VSRRNFVSTAAAAACASCPLLAGVAHAAAAAREPIDAGPAADFEPDTIATRWAAGGGFFVVRRGDRIFAVSSVCTHRKVRLVASGGGDAPLKCPRHGSTFDADGHVTRSPARKPLPRFAVRLNDAGHLLVDRSTVFGEKDWDDPSAFVRVKREGKHEPPM
jgi:cytochrome b6-f complex iron-sulfur subunit